MFNRGKSATRLNLGPMLKGFASLEDALDPRKVLARMKRGMERALRQRIQEFGFSPEARTRLSRGFTVRVGDSSITIRAKDPAFRPLIQGQEAKQMRWLLKSPTPIPITLDSGEVIFRNATARSMADGSWYHPGRENSNILEAAKAEVRDQMTAFFQKELVKIAKGKFRG